MVITIRAWSIQFPRKLACSIVICVPLVCATACGYGIYTRPGLEDAPASAAGTIALRLLLVGDAGEEAITRSDEWPLFDELARDLQVAAPSAVVFLGDNVYPAGVPVQSDHGETQTAERILRALLAATASADDVIFIPGNHDWNDSRSGGYARVLAQGALIERLDASTGRARLLPPSGCPGPVTLDLADMVRLVAIDTEWLLTPDDPRRKPLGPGTGCTHGPPQAPLSFPGDDLTARTFYEALASHVRGGGTRAIVLLAHHPLRSNGPHGGYLGGSWLPFVGPAIRRLIPSPQDFASRVNRDMRARIDDILHRADARLIVTAAGHDHSLQVFEEAPGVYYLVSGSGSKTSPAGRTATTLFKHGAQGYLRLDFLVDRSVHLTAVEPATQPPPLSIQLDQRRTGNENARPE